MIGSPRASNEKREPTRERTGFDYRSSHVSPDQRENYERLYSPGTHDSRIWEYEKAVISEIVRTNFSSGLVNSYLDFACGTGRLLSFLETTVSRSVGIDISEEMANVAKRRVSKSTVVVGDPTRSPDLVQGSFDLITAFRFFLNSDDTLRDDAVSFMRAVLASNGILLFNIHGNAWSLRSVGAAIRKYVLRQDGISLLSLRQMRRVLTRQEFRIVSVYGVGFLPSKLAKLFGEGTTSRIEERLQSIHWLRFFASDLICVAKHR